MEINSRDVAIKLYRLVYYIKGQAFMLQAQDSETSNDEANRLFKEADHIEEMANELFDAKVKITS